MCLVEETFWICQKICSHFENLKMYKWIKATNKSSTILISFWKQKESIEPSFKGLNSVLSSQQIFLWNIFHIFFLFCFAKHEQIYFVLHTWYIAVFGKSKQTAQQRIPPKRDSSFSFVCDVLGCTVESIFFRLCSGSSSAVSFVVELLLLADWLIGGGRGFDCDDAVSTWISDKIGIIFELSTFKLTACCWFCISDDIDDAELLGSTMSAILAKW